MNKALKRVLGFALTLATIPWSQGAVCPMELQSRNQHSCGAMAPAVHHASRSQVSGEHDCCPQGHQRHVASTQCPPVHIEACNAPMNCCSVDPQPAKSPQVATTIDHPATFELIPVSVVGAPERSGFVSEKSASLFEHSVFRFKEDLRV